MLALQPQVPAAGVAHPLRPELIRSQRPAAADQHQRMSGARDGTLRRRASATKPSLPPLLQRTEQKMTTSFSRPCSGKIGSVGGSSKRPMHAGIDEYACGILSRVRMDLAVHVSPYMCNAPC